MSMAAEVYELVANEWSVCGLCGDYVAGRQDGKNLPCGHVAELVSVCPTWAPSSGCQCAHRYAANRFQELLDDTNWVATERRAARVISTAEQWRPGRAAWILFVMTVILVTCGLNTMR